VVWPELAATIPAERARMACGDVWAHALEGFLSPLAKPELRRELAGLLQEMLRLPLGNDPAWFDVSAQACAAQARSSVGLVHGIAHTLEEKGPWGHAQLCATYLLPVMRFNLEVSAKPQALLAEFAIDRDAVLRALSALHDPETYRRSLPVLSENWKSVLRDPSTRTNCALVRPQHLDFFTK
jgi:alcohol dehydrogenase class IV